MTCSRLSFISACALGSLLLPVVGCSSEDPGGEANAGAGGGGAAGAGGAAAGDGGQGAGGSGGSPVAQRDGCDGATLLEVPADPAEKGPWEVGVRTVQVGNLDVEVWYPAPAGSGEDAEPAVYDIREWLPEGEAAKVSDDKHGPPQGQGGFRDLPIDDKHGPYPVVVHIHGTASFRVASAEQTVHWASRGFVVVATDHPGLFLGDMLASVSGGACTPGPVAQDLSRDVDAMLAALSSPSGDLAFLDGAIDMGRIGIAGHSAGASAAASMTGKPNVEIVLPLSTGSGSVPSPSLKSTLILSGIADTVIPWATNQRAYADSPAPKRLVGIDNAGHLVMSVLCGLRNPEGQDLVEVGQEAGICGMDLASFLWDCSDGYISQDLGAEIINYATSAALEETLHCADRSEAFSDLETTYAEVGVFEENL